MGRQFRLSPYAPLPALMRSLRRAGWGELTGREWQGVRSTLEAVVSRASDATGVAETTAWQIAQSAGLSEKWVRRCLHVLEELGVVQWHRGGVAYGKPQPSIFRVVKAALVDLVKAARPIKDAADRAQRIVTSKRLRKIRTGFAKSKPPHRRTSDHAELSSSLRPQGEGSPRPGPPRRPSEPLTLVQIVTEALPQTKIEAPPAPSLDNDRPAPFDPAVRAGADLVRAAAGLTPRGARP
jgi:DNA-binding IscR family transcriptional regulator